MLWIISGFAIIAASLCWLVYEFKHPCEVPSWVDLDEDEERTVDYVNRHIA